MTKTMKIRCSIFTLNMEEFEMIEDACQHHDMRHRQGAVTNLAELLLNELSKKSNVSTCSAEQR